MKKSILLLLSILVFSCNKKEEKSIIQNHETVAKEVNPLDTLKYATNLDLYCKMDNTKYGVSDTTYYKGKLYGFCAKMCKDEFKKNPEKYLAKK